MATQFALPLQATGLQEAFASLRRDLIHPDGPQISTMRNYRFAIVQYDPREEFKLRGEVQRLSSDLVAAGWMVLTIDLQQLFLERIRRQPDDFAQRLVEAERRLGEVAPERGLTYLKTKLHPLIEGQGGLAADCVRQIDDHVARHPDQADRTLVLIGRAGALYPFYRSSALLRHLDGHTHNVPVVLLYPGERRSKTGLSFMGELNPDNDYRPRIYP
jgi:hypothetical protein